MYLMAGALAFSVAHLVGKSPLPSKLTAMKTQGFISWIVLQNTPFGFL